MRLDRKTKTLIKVAKWSMIAGLAGDAILLTTGYYYYQQLKNSRDFRYKLFTYDPRYIDIYYRANERYGDGKAREKDYQEWGVNKIESFNFLSLFGL